LVFVFIGCTRLAGSDYPMDTKFLTLSNWVDLVYTQPPVLHTQILLRTLKRRFSRHKDDREVYSKCTLKYTTPPFWYSSSSLGAL